jgi:hypothetical protein
MVRLCNYDVLVTSNGGQNLIHHVSQSIVPSSSNDHNSAISAILCLDLTEPSIAKE